MDAGLQLPVLALTAALLTLTLKKHSPELSLALSLCACVLGILVLIDWFTPLLRLAKSLEERADLGESLTAPLWKCLGIGLLTEVSSALCTDAGQAALAKLVELGGSVLCLVVSLPLLQAVLALIEELI